MMDFYIMTDDQLTEFIRRVYQEIADDLELTIEEMFNLRILKRWFRTGCPPEMDGMSPGMIRLVTLPLFDLGLLNSEEYPR